MSVSASSPAFLRAAPVLPASRLPAPALVPPARFTPMRRARAGPLLSIVLLLAAWTGARVMLWDDPYAPSLTDYASAAPGAPGTDMAALDGTALVGAPPSVFAATAPIGMPESGAQPFMTGPALTPAMAPPPAYAMPRSPAMGPGPAPGSPSGGNVRARNLSASAPPRPRGYAQPSGVPAAGYRAEPLPSRFGPDYLLPPGRAASAAASPASRKPAVPAPSKAAPATAPAAAAAAAAVLPGTPGEARRAARAGGVDRLRLDTWAFWRQESAAAPLGAGLVPVYGASQAGALLQYRLAPRSPHAPALYARAFSALTPGAESELAAGVSARPLARLPVRLAGEARVLSTALGTEVRPGALAWTELNPVSLPYQTRLEAYGQAGWVGGSFSTLFADGQAVITRDLAALPGLGGRGGRTRVSLGAGAWGGAQRGAARVDVGPTVHLDFAVGRVPARVSVDWRQRALGNAEPDSGLAVTLSSGF